MGEALAVGLWNILVFLSNFLVKTIIFAGAAVLLRHAGWAAAGIVAVLAAVTLLVRRRRS